MFTRRHWRTSRVSVRLAAANDWTAMDPNSLVATVPRPTLPPACPLFPPIDPLPEDQPPLPVAELPGIEDRSAPTSPELRQLATAVTSAIIEVLRGRRALVQLERWLEPELLDLLGHLQRSRTGVELRLRSVRVQNPNPGRLEVSAHLLQGARSRAAALRMVLRSGQWVCTHLELALGTTVVNRAG